MAGGPARTPARRRPPRRSRSPPRRAGPSRAAGRRAEPGGSGTRSPSTTRAASVATSRALLDACTDLRLPAGRQRHRGDQGVGRRQEMERGGLGPGAVLGAGVDQADQSPGEREPEGDGGGRCDPAGHRDPPADDDARHRQPEEDDLEQPERAEGARDGAGATDGRAVSTSTCTSSRTVIGGALGLRRPRGAPTPRPPRSFRRACARSARRPTRPRRRASRG